MNGTDKLSKSIIQTLLYFDIFNYPLDSKEVFQFLQTNHVTPKVVHDKLCELSDNKLAFRFGNFFTLQNNPILIDRRVKGNEEAARFMFLAHRQAGLIQRFPFIKAVMASGSLSKGYMDESCDLDFFIITQSKRLWIARTLLVIYKRLFLANSHKYFCVNYFIDESSLEIEEKNLYTATELITLIPLTGMTYHKKLMESNQWVSNYLPNSGNELNNSAENEKPPFIKTILEFFFNFLLPDTTNSFLMKLTMNRWRKLYEKKYCEADFKIAFKTTPNVSKNHPNYYQRKVIDLYNKKNSDYCDRYQLKWQS